MLADQGRLEMVIPIGMYLMNIVKTNKGSPEMVRIHPNDDAKEVSLKHLIRDMTSPFANKRCRMQKVEYLICQLTGAFIHY